MKIFSFIKNLDNKIIFFILIIIILITTFNHIKNSNEQNVIKYTSKYTIKIDYPNTQNKKLNKQLKKYINKKKKEFLKLIKTDNKQQYNFTATYSITTSQEIESINLVIYYNSNVQSYLKEEQNYHYNKNNNQIITLNYYLHNQNKQNYLKELINIQIKEYFNKQNIKIDNDLLNLNLEAYKQFYFNETGLNITLPNSNIIISIPYHKIQNIINSKYFLNTQEVSNLEEFNSRDLTIFYDKKLIAFTFDDGPNKSTTNKLLDNLEKYNARVTFFILGSRINNCKECIKKAYKMGNQIGNHTYNHANLYSLKDELIIEEIENTNNEIKKIIGTSPTLLRPPYGNTNSHIKNLTNMYTILWNIDTLDWKYKNKTKIKNIILKNAQDGAIILLHDIYKSSIEGALLAMEELEKENYAFVTIDEMIIIKNIQLSKDETYHQIKTINHS